MIVSVFAENKQKFDQNTIEKNVNFKNSLTISKEILSRDLWVKFISYSIERGQCQTKFTLCKGFQNRKEFSKGGKIQNF